MLFTYLYTPHPMEILQEYVCFIFHEVWCKAEPGKLYDIEILFVELPELKDMIQELHYQDYKSANDFMEPLQALFESFKKFDANQKHQFKSWFALNNDIRQLCEHGDQCLPATYDRIETAFPEGQFPDLIKQLKRFYQNLYSHSFLKLKSVQDRIGTIDDHNDAFTQINSRDVCPFCGLSGMFNRYNSKREAYDHYFPKDKYPFNSINFLNLVPACHHCNSSYKLAKDPSHDSKDPLKQPRKVFFPFTTKNDAIELSVTLNTTDWENLIPDHIAIEYGPKNVAQEIDTWNDLYGIDERYRVECSSRGAGKAWLTEVLDEWKNLGEDPGKYLNRLELHCKRDPYVDKRFLKKAFLEGCQRAGLFDEDSVGGSRP